MYEYTNVARVNVTSYWMRQPLELKTEVVWAYIYIVSSPVSRLPSTHKELLHIMTFEPVSLRTRLTYKVNMCIIHTHMYLQSEHIHCTCTVYY